MPLNNEQIERYSRQIIVPGIGGIAQERLIAARLMLIGEIRDAEAVLAYMVGAGVGRIDLRLPGLDTAAQASLIGRMRDLNSDVSVNASVLDSAKTSLILALVASNAVIDTIRALCRGRCDTPIVLARLDTPPRIAIFPQRPPCPACADTDLLVPFADRSDHASFVALVAATEAFKMTTGAVAVARPTLIQFKGYQSAVREIRTQAHNRKCACRVCEAGEPR
jgi:hypothetical protein